MNKTLRKPLQRERPDGWLLAGALFGPPALMSAYLTLSHWPLPRGTNESDLAFFTYSIGFGVICLARLPLPAVWRMSLISVYVPLAGLALLVFTLYFLSHVFGVSG